MNIWSRTHTSVCPLVHFPNPSHTLVIGRVVNGGQCPRLKSSMPFRHDLALQNIPLSKQPFKTQPQSENEDVTRSPQHNLPTTRANNRRALSLQKVELGWLILYSSHCIENMYHIIHAQV